MSGNISTKKIRDFKDYPEQLSQYQYHYHPSDEVIRDRIKAVKLSKSMPLQCPNPSNRLNSVFSSRTCLDSIKNEDEEVVSFSQRQQLYASATKRMYHRIMKGRIGSHRVADITSSIHANSTGKNVESSPCRIRKKNEEVMERTFVDNRHIRYSQQHVLQVIQPSATTEDDISLTPNTENEDFVLSNYNEHFDLPLAQGSDENNLPPQYNEEETGLSSTLCSGPTEDEQIFELDDVY